MSYFGGTGGGRGWHTLRIIVEPQLLREVLAPIGGKLVRAGRVPADYRGTSLDEFIERYAAFLAALASSAAVPWPVEEAIGLSLLSEAADIEVNPAKHEGFVVLTPAEPPITCSAARLFVDPASGRLRCDTHSDLLVGLCWSYPAKVSYDRDGFATVHDTAGLPEAAMYRRLVDSVKQHTRPLTVRSARGVHRPPIRVSEAMKRDLSQWPRLASAGLTVV